jgi:quercetin dioxygenase-like cupin family protein
MWRLEGQEHRHLVGIMVSTEHLTVGTFELLPGQQTDLHIHGGDEGLYVLEGTLHVRVPEHSGPRWHELKPGDGFYIPQGAPHQYYNISGSTVRIAFGVAPHYLADA